jgi:hypothetical protein
MTLPSGRRITPQKSNDRIDDAKRQVAAMAD